MSTRLLCDKENVVSGTPTVGMLQMKARLAAEPGTSIAAKILATTSCEKSTAFTPRRALGNVSNNRNGSLTEPSEVKKPTFLVPQTPSRRRIESVPSNSAPQVISQEDDYPEIESIPTAFEEDDYEDIWPKAYRLSSGELDRLASWRPLLPDVKSCVFEPDDLPEAVDCEDDYKPISDYCGNQETFSIPDLLDNSPMQFVPPPSPVDRQALSFNCVRV